MNNQTKQQLGQSLRKLVEDKPLDKITISDITDDCGVSRMTFYYHFKDIYDLVEWMCITDAEEALLSGNESKTWQEGFMNVFEFLQKNKSFVINVYHSVSRDHLELFVNRVSTNIFAMIIDSEDSDSSLNESDKLFIADFYKYAIVGIILNWVDKGMKDNPKEIVKKLELLIEGNIEDAITRFLNRN